MEGYRNGTRTEAIVLGICLTRPASSRSLRRAVQYIINNDTVPASILSTIRFTPDDAPFFYFPEHLIMKQKTCKSKRMV
jgi:hypothetical protein